MEIERKIHDLIEAGIKRIYIYPFGNRGVKVYGFIQACYEGINVIRVDNRLCKFNKNILSYKQLVEIIEKESPDQAVVFLCSDNPKIYQELRIAVNQDIGATKVVDLFAQNPFCFDNDNRISSLAMAGKQIYKNHVEGAVAEAGVYRGDFSQYINMIFPDRKLYLFDTFEGFVENQINKSRDNLDQTDIWINTLRDTTVEVVLNKMEYKDKVVFCKGIFPQTAKTIDEKFAFVNLDMDLYYPIYNGLEYFWERMSPGGIIFVHDYGNWDGVTNAVDKFCSENKAGYIWLNDLITVAISKPLY